MSNKSLLVIFFALFSVQAFGKKEVFSQKGQGFYKNIQFLIDAARARLILENVGPEIQSLINQLELSLPRLKREVKQKSRQRGRVSEAQILLWQVEAEIQAFGILTKEFKDLSRDLIKKQMLWEKLLRTFLLLEEESRRDLLGLVFAEGKSFLLRVMKEVSNFDLMRIEEDGLSYISECLRRWDEKVEKEQEKFVREAEAQAKGFPAAQPMLRRQKAMLPFPKRPDSVNRGYVPEV